MGDSGLSVDRLMGTIAPNAPFPPPRVAPNQPGVITSRGEMARQAVNTIAPVAAVSP